MQHYELMVIFSPILSEDEYKVIIEKYITSIKKEKGAIVKSEPWGLKNLAYPIKKKSVGLYWVATYKVNEDAVVNFDKNIRTVLFRDEQILRYMITKLNKDSLKYNLARIENKNKPVENTNILDEPEVGEQVLEKQESEKTPTPNVDSSQA